MKTKTKLKVGRPKNSGKIKKELQKLLKKYNGLLMPETIVEEARDVKNPLHNCFEWDNSKAAEQYRIQQARRLLTICVDYEPSTNKAYRVFVSLNSDRRNKGGYRDVITVMNNPTQREQLLDDAKREMQIFMEKFARLNELAKIFREMKKFLK